jgi:hypothetical protein
MKHLSLLLLVASLPACAEGLEEQRTENELGTPSAPDYASCRSSDDGDASGNDPWVMNIGNQCAITAEVNAKIAAGFFTGTQQEAEDLVDCIVKKLKFELEPTNSLPCFHDAYGTQMTPHCTNALAFFEAVCGGPIVTMTEI